MIKAGVPVFFGCDVGKFSDQTTGIMDPALFEYAVNTIFSLIDIWLIYLITLLQSAFDIELKLTKAQRLQMCESMMTHAMVITGVHIDVITGQPVRYKVENSWGDATGKDGFYVMTDSWFEEWGIFFGS